MINCLFKFPIAIPIKTGAEIAKELDPVKKKHKMKRF